MKDARETPIEDEEGLTAADGSRHDRAGLRASEERLRLATQSGAGVGVLDYDVVADRGLWSPEACSLLGVPVGDCTTLAESLAFCHPDDRGRVERAMAAAMDPRGSGGFLEEFRIHVAGTGEWRWVSSACQTLFEGVGDSRRPLRFMGVVTDITARKVREERQAFLLKLSDALRPLGDPLDVQEVAARLLGEHLGANRVGYAEIDGRDYVIRREYAPGVRPLVGKGPAGTFGAALRGAYQRGEMVVVNDVGADPRFTEAERLIMQARQIAAYVGVTLIKGGRLVAAFGANNATPRVWTSIEVELIRDVAERTWEAVERARAETALREREQRLRLALDASRAGSWMRDARTGRVDWDDRLRELLGFTAEEPASFEAWLSRLHEEDRPQQLELLDQLHLNVDTFDTTFRIVRPDGSVSWIQSLGQVHRDTEGQAIQLTGIVLDVTERRRAEETLQARHAEERDRTLHKEAEEALRRSHAELERRTLQLSRLASQLTLAEQSVRKQLASTLHDGLQQLLFSAVMTLDQAVKANSREDQVGLLQRVRADIKEAMDAARTLSVNLFPPVLHVGGLPAALVWLAKRTQEQYSVVVSVTADPRANPEASDVRFLLFEGVRELLFNAVKHAHVDRVDVNLALGPDDIIHIQVSDEGVGFDPSVTLYHKNQHQVGLGLFSIQERLALLGGHLDIQSAPGKGARFSLNLPRTGLPRLATDGAEVRRHDTGWQERLVRDSASATSKVLRILIADDHAVARRGLRELFSEHSALQVVSEAANGVEAISQAMALQPDVIVMDVSMRQMNGIEAGHEIHRTLPHIRIVGLSTHDDENTERSMREAGAEAYFTKNEGTDRLLDYLLSVLAQVKELRNISAVPTERGGRCNGPLDQKGTITSIGIQCALCHSTVDDSFAPGIGRRLDGWANRDLNVGAIVALSPDLSAVTRLLGVDDSTLRKVLSSWGPGKFDAEVFLDGKAFRDDGKSAATLIPPAFGLAGVNLHTWTGWGSVTHWNAFVANLEMHGKGTFFDPRLNDAGQFPIAARSGFGDVHNDPALITPKLAALHFYQLAIPAPENPTVPVIVASRDWSAGFNTQHRKRWRMS